MKRLIKVLKAAIASAKEDNEEMDIADWNYQEGVVLSFNEAQHFVETYELLKESRDQLVMCSFLDKSGQCEEMVNKIDKLIG